MKIKKSIFFLSSILMLSCSLDEKIYDTTVADSFIQSESDALALLNGVYAYNPAFSGFKSNLHRIILYGGDDIAVTTSTYRVYNDRSMSSTDVYLNPIWQFFYQVINVSNSFIKGVDDADGLTVEFKERMLGEGYFMRAFSYFYMVRIFGGVGIRTEPTEGGSDFYQPRNTIDEVYQQIFEDFTKASEQCLLFSEQPTAELGHATKGAAQGLLALAYLTYGNYLDLEGGNPTPYYTLAKTYADSVIASSEYSLLNNYSDLWNVNNEATSYKEVIFSIMHTRDGTAASASSKGSELPYYTQPANRWYISGQPPNGRGAGILRIQPWFYDLYQTGDYVGDYRSEVSFLTRFQHQDSGTDRITYPETRNASEAVEQFPYLDKYRDSDAYQGRNSENDFYILRLAEIYLIKAEAENELNGPNSEAYTAFNMLRSRARAADGNTRLTPVDLPPGLTKEEFRLSVFQERGLELVGEGHRWFDACRMRYLNTDKSMIRYRYEDFYPSMSNSAPIYSSGTNTWGGGRVQPANVVPWSPRFLRYPIPSNEIDSNPNVGQNIEFGW